MRHYITKGKIDGAASAPPSKSDAHRRIICAALSGRGAIRGVSLSEDIRATLDAVRLCGVRAVLNGGEVSFKEENSTENTVDCGESGTTLRLMMPVAAALGAKCTFAGRGRLPDRPLGVYAEVLPAHGVSMSRTRLPVTLSGTLTGGEFAVRGDSSSQFISGLLLALPLIAEDSRITLTSPLESAGYVDMTLAAMRDAGVTAMRDAEGWRIPGGQRYAPCDIEIEGDWSQAAFLLAMGAIGGGISVSGLRHDSRQGDRAAEEIFREMGADIFWNGDTLICNKSRLQAVKINAADIPDLVPVLAAAASLAEGETVISGAARLREKESDRLEAMTRVLGGLGADIRETADGLVIKGKAVLAGGEADGCNDHRVVMSAAVAALGCAAPVTITGTQAVMKSWPDFWEVYNLCGGEARVIDHGE